MALEKVLSGLRKAGVNVCTKLCDEGTVVLYKNKTNNAMHSRLYNRKGELLSWSKVNGDGFESLGKINRDYPSTEIITPKRSLYDYPETKCTHIHHEGGHHYSRSVDAEEINRYGLPKLPNEIRPHSTDYEFGSLTSRFPESNFGEFDGVSKPLNDFNKSQNFDDIIGSDPYNPFGNDFGNMFGF
ncbi:MAG: hypothetical protein LBK53_09865 [Heliobacteriaceae bacterium]|jgi:hypothetical protein|nr:hypothetical protein [Heliobacteriaceae bacterium]